MLKLYVDCDSLVRQKLRQLANRRERGLSQTAEMAIIAGVAIAAAVALGTLVNAAIATHSAKIK